ncbi:hypothetical protein F53441_9784 [Fusarium austroafricanum]|uniref:Anaphase-promoting complex subunit 4 WD40 domain-containing protein n=1 Tax=Fusarium austroafricanum TaxID=2364996 RepID=A0A8H4K8A6_9HYPO|nr:hypothetical protein F53441_9784 [Fusarium austroafricanum]
MTCYSSDQLLTDWRYAVEQDFTASTGERYVYADNGKLQWGDETKKMTFKTQPHMACVSSNTKYLALAVEHDIHIIDTEDWNTIAVLRGHTTKVNAMAFRPNNDSVLVSSGEPDYSDRDEEEKEEATVILWNIDEERTATLLEDDSLTDATHHTASAAADKLETLGVKLSHDVLHHFKKILEPVMRRTVSKHLAAGKTTISGRLTSSHQSQIFSPSGRWITYLPGERPRSNGNDQWDIQISAADDLSNGLLLKGHTDAIMWIGWSADESLFASVAWDQSIRIWDAATGQEKHVFMTEGQNWAGAFSPDSTYFAAADGLSNIRVYSISSGELHWMYEGKPSDDWRRTLDWHPNNKWLAVGGERSGEVLILDVEEKKLLQRRLLSADACLVDDKEVRRMIKDFVGTLEVRFYDGGNKLVVWTFGDWSVEVYDLNQQVKRRFGRGGTEDGPEAVKWRDDEGKATSKGSHDMVAWENRSKGLLQLATLDFDGVRIWEVPLAG